MSNFLCFTYFFRKLCYFLSTGEWSWNQILPILICIVIRVLFFFFSPKWITSFLELSIPKTVFDNRCISTLFLLSCCTEKLWIIYVELLKVFLSLSCFATSPSLLSFCCTHTHFYVSYLHSCHETAFFFASIFMKCSVAPLALGVTALCFLYLVLNHTSTGLGTTPWKCPSL